MSRIDGEKPLIYVVDQHDEVIGEGRRHDLSPDDIYRVSSVLVYNANNDLLIAQRKSNKIKEGGMWGPSVAGTVEVGETYVENATKETCEELGITESDFVLKSLVKKLVNAKYTFYCEFCETTIDKPAEWFTPQASEVEQVAWSKRGELRNDIVNNPKKYVSGMLDIVELSERTRP